MTSNLRRWLVVATVLVAVGSLLAVTPSTLVAQIRAALVKNVDEPWRTPWETRTQILPNAGGCWVPTDCYDYLDGSGYAIFNVRAVPAGKRWVVQSVTGWMAYGNGRTNQIELGSPRGFLVFDGTKWAFTGPFSAGTAFDSAVFSEKINVTFGPGETPFVRITATPSLGGYTVIVISGYLIDATN